LDRLLAWLFGGRHGLQGLGRRCRLGNIDWLGIVVRNPYFIAS